MAETAPDKWITGQLGGVCTDSHDHIAVVNRRDITEEEIETGMQAPPILVFDRIGALVSSFRDPDAVPGSIHGCTFDRGNNCVCGWEQRRHRSKYSHDGKLLMQIGTRESSIPRMGPAGGRSRTRVVRGSSIQPAWRSIRRTATSTWPMATATSGLPCSTATGASSGNGGSKATAAETEAGAPGVFANVVHCIAISNALAWSMSAIDRATACKCSTRAGKFVRNIWIRAGTPTLPDARGTAWRVAFSRDAAQKHIYVMNGRNGNRARAGPRERKDPGDVRTSRPSAGKLHHGHTLAVDSVRQLGRGRSELGPAGAAIKPVPWSGNA